MNEAENFVARWSRLKQEAGSGAQTDPPPETDGAAPPVFDPALLPPIESITQASDICPFLQSGVPAELMRAALRAAWAADPAIRDFVGIAESQWDFNDPAAMPGFGPLEATENVQWLVAQAASRLSRPPEAIVRIAESAARPTESVVQIPLSSSMDDANASRVTMACAAPEASKVESEGSGRHRRHGSALPKPA